jgi:lycopene beta-cyclase
LSRFFGSDLILNSEVKKLTPSSVELSDGTLYESRCVIDGRGFGEVVPEKVGYQKFVGLDITLDQPHGLKNPILMDVTCPQEDGFRFFYLLPWSENELLIEDTRYSNTGSVSVSEYVDRIQRYIQGRGWKIASIDREEVGSLPIPMVKDFWTSKEKASLIPGVPCVGVRGNLFHPVTGYSFSYAVKLADLVSQFSDLESVSLNNWINNYTKKEEGSDRFFYLLNRMMFLAAEPEDRYKVLQRFYRLPKSLIQRFYAGRLKFHDYVRILSGQPPVPIQRAVRCLFDKRERIQLENNRHDV